MRINHRNFLYQLTFLPMVFPVTSYLVDEGEELSLIDTA
ncbi:metallo-beta-lactamase family protein [Niallia nealsonii AAU1]|nr:metallo-beta-lactamase family protein [Niallia nealsonii AAU1]